MSSTSVFQNLWEFFSLLLHVPFLIIFIVGFIFAWQWKKTKGHPAGLVVVACTLGIISQLLSASSFFVIRAMLGQQTETMAMILGCINTTNRLVHFIYITMLLYAALHPYFKNR